MNNTMEKLRVYKQVCLKIRSTLVSGREDLVSPTLVTRNFVEGFTSSLNDRVLSEHALDQGEDSSMYTGVNSTVDCGPVCPFIKQTEGWK